MQKIHYIFILIFLQVFCACKINTDTGKPKNRIGEIPYLGNLIADYYYYYYEYPIDMDDLIDFFEYCINFDPDFYIEPDKTNILLITLPRCKSSKIVFETKNGFSAFLGKDTIIHFTEDQSDFSPCEINEYIGGDSHEYYVVCRKYSRTRFFDNQNKAVIISNKNDSIFKDSIFALQRKYLDPVSLLYHSYDYEGEKMSIQTLLEYIQDKGFRYFCDKGKPVSDIVYYHKLEEFLSRYCNTHGFSRAILMSPDYY